MHKKSKPGWIEEDGYWKGQLYELLLEDETPTDVLLKAWAAFSTQSSLGVSVSTFHFITVCGGLKSIAGLVKLVSHSAVPVCIWNSTCSVFFYWRAYGLVGYLWLYSRRALLIFGSQLTMSSFLPPLKSDGTSKLVLVSYEHLISLRTLFMPGCCKRAP